MASSSTELTDDDDPPVDTGHVTPLTGNGLDLFDDPQLNVSRPPSVFQGSSHLTVHKDVADYVSTPALEEAYGILQDRGWVVLCGPPGSGKTTLAHALCRMSSEHDQYAVYILEKVHLWKSHVGEMDQSVVMMDGNFGRCYLNEGQYCDWQMIFNTILEMIKKGGIRLVITVYPHILHELQQLNSHLDSFLTDDSGVVWLTDTLPEEVRENMLNFHLKKLHLNSDTQRQTVETVLKNDESGPVFPWCCGQMVKQWSPSEDNTSVFLVPAEAHATLFKDMILDKAYGSVFVAVLVLTMKGLSNFLHNLGEGKAILKRLDMPKVYGDTLARFADILHGQKSILFNGTFSIRALYEAAGLALGRYFRLPTLLRVCDVPFLMKYVRCTLKEQAVTCVTVGGVPGCSRDPKSCTADQQALVERIYNEIIERNLQTICQHPVLQCSEFLKELDRYCAQDMKRMKQLLNADDTVHQLPLVYWLAFLPSPILTQWCLDKMQRVKQLPVVSLMAHSLFDHVTQTSPSRVHSFLSERLIANLFEHQSCTMEFPFLYECLTKEIEQKMKPLCTTELVRGRLNYLLNPSLPLPPDLVTVQVSQDRLKLQVKDRRLWYLVFRLLTDRGVVETDKDGDSLLHVAVNSGEKGVVRLLLEAGAVISQKNKKGVTPYQLTQPARAQAAKKRTQSDTYDIFERFFQADNTDAQLHLLYDIGVNQMNNEGKTLLILCCECPRDGADIISLLIQIGADVNAQFRQPRTFSKVPNNVIIASILGPIARGVLHFLPLIYSPSPISFCDMNAKDMFGDTPLLLAAKNGHFQTAQLLLQHGARVNVHSTDGDTPLLWAASKGHSDTVEHLLKTGADVDAQNKMGDTPLLWATMFGHSDTVQQLLKHGANVNTQNVLSYTPLLLAAMYDHCSTAQVLLEHNADTNAKTQTGSTPLMLAMKHQHPDICRLLTTHAAKGSK